MKRKSTTFLCILSLIGTLGSTAVFAGEEAENKPAPPTLHIQMDMDMRLSLEPAQQFTVEVEQKDASTQPEEQAQPEAAESTAEIAAADAFPSWNPESPTLAELVDTPC